MNETVVSGERAEKLREEFKLPVYVYSYEVLVEKARMLLKAAQGFHVSYAMKANNNSKILQILREEGIAHVDVVSPGEIVKALKVGYTPDQILYTENFMDSEDLEEALQANVMLNIGALDTLRHFGEKLRGRQIFIRLNPNKGAGENYKVITGGPESKFGISEHEIAEVCKIAEERNIKIVGLHQHIGSNLKKQDREVFIETTKFVFEKHQNFPHLRYINIGGGIGIKYKAEEQTLDIEELYECIRKIRDQVNPKIQIWIEPGRYLVGDCGALLCQITARKQTSHRVFYGTNTGFNHLIRPAFYRSHHNIVNLSSSHEGQQEKATICGNICESSDNLGTDIEMSGKIGDILCIENAGAYGFSMSSNFNERLRPAEILMKGNDNILIRRREKYSDLQQKI